VRDGDRKKKGVGGKGFVVARVLLSEKLPLSCLEKMTWNAWIFSTKSLSFFIRTPHTRTHVCRYHDSHFAFILRDEKLEE
jgi:hypothetical protein